MPLCAGSLGTTPVVAVELEEYRSHWGEGNRLAKGSNTSLLSNLGNKSLGNRGGSSNEISSSPGSENQSDQLNH